MKKLLIGILIALLLLLSGFIVFIGIKSLGILGFKDIQKESKELESQHQTAEKLVAVDYNKAVDEINSAYQKYETTKQEYEELSTVNVDENGKAIGMLKEYDYENLLVKVGNYATKENAIMKMNIVQGNSAIPNIYELHFEVTGSYISIVDFISDLENDSALGFKIEQFQMVEKGENELEAKFITKEIIINDISEISESDQPQEQEQEQEQGQEEKTKDEIKSNQEVDKNNSENIVD